MTGHEGPHPVPAQTGRLRTWWNIRVGLLRARLRTWLHITVDRQTFQDRQQLAAKRVREALLDEHRLIEGLRRDLDATVGELEEKGKLLAEAVQQLNVNTRIIRTYANAWPPLAKALRRQQDADKRTAALALQERANRAVHDELVAAIPKDQVTRTADELTEPAMPDLPPITLMDGAPAELHPGAMAIDREHCAEVSADDEPSDDELAFRESRKVDAAYDAGMAQRDREAESGAAS